MADQPEQHYDTPGPMSGLDTELVQLLASRGPPLATH